MNFFRLTEGGESHNGDEDSSESDGDEPSLSQEPKAPRNPSTGGGSQPGSTVHRPRGTNQHFLLSAFTDCFTGLAKLSLSKGIVFLMKLKPR